MNKDVITFLVVGTIITALIAIYCAKKGMPVKVGNPLFSAKIN